MLGLHARGLRLLARCLLPRGKKRNRIKRRKRKRTRKRTKEG
ncbi:hypothetical protein Phi46:1_gp42 [Cellulophaga phage phi46:1]|nr:hypothetical protein Phi46:1_gp42 [Cellulophaga phage phi46:1]AGO47853.1 hypothetical protein Phi46:1_gp42 [Cellulophaga phage phi46:1]